MSNTVAKALTVFITIGAAVAVGAATLAVSVPYGEVTIDGGTESGTLDGNAFAGGAGGTATELTGSIKNKMTGIITDCTITLKRSGTAGGIPTFTSATVGDGSGTAATTPAGDGASATATFTGIAGNACAAFTLVGVNSGGASDIICNVTPSFSSADGEANSLASFDFDDDTDLLRHSIGEMSHSVLIVPFSNSDIRNDIVTLSGTLTIPASAAQYLSSAVVRNNFDSTTVIAGSSVSVSGNTFSVNGIDIGNAGSAAVFLTFSGDIPFETISCLLEAGFAPH